MKSGACSNVFDIVAGGWRVPGTDIRSSKKDPSIANRSSLTTVVTEDAVKHLEVV